MQKKGDMRMATRKASSGYAPNIKPRLKLLSTEQLQQIHLASLEVLERTGVDVGLPEAVNLLGEAGADVRDPHRTKIPSYLVDEALRTTPHRITIYDREGRPAMHLEGRNCYFGTGTDTPFVIDPYSGERRPTRGEDVDCAARLSDALANIDFVGSMGSVSEEEVPAAISDRHNFFRICANTTKPILYTTWDREGIEDIYDMAVAVRGGDPENFRRKPFIIQYAEPISPLCHPRTSMEKLIFCARKGIPVTYAAGTMMGGTVPVTAAGALVVTNAEFLSGLVIAQLARKGAPVIYGGCSGPLDMRTSVCSYGGPDAYQNYIMVRELAAYYDLPDFNYGGYSESKIIDMQAAAEAALSIFQIGLAGSCLVHDVGYLESGMSSSLEMILFCDEIIDQVRHFKNVPSIDAQTLAMQVIDEVAPGGNFTGHDHTLQHFKKIWYPKLFDRRNYQNWTQDGGQSLEAVLREKVQHLLETHQPKPLSEKVAQQLESVLQRAKGGLSDS
jgi:trimethylamine--corrinoid protein Co-methyltransferase